MPARLSAAAAPAPAAAHVNPVDAVLMGLPFGQWVPMPEVARRVREAGLDGSLLTAMVRRHRRRGVLRTDRQPTMTYVMRVGNPG
ncbi:hypothetical protein EV284_6365 [Streptomyces sp. BK022]|uniref:hypothetical protein n=1 Tax=Streptomyces sp. BK022 TaxID=2512123 RepID=UPI0010E36616|nr:hypothetical protein [Streptomyces sp. BK022]RZU28199.1 hypothetical protein EV284_6365 [Streptomyces sp. BK022]